MDVNRRILIVDDNEAIHQDIRKVLLRETGSSKLAELTKEILGESSEDNNPDPYIIESALQGDQALAMVKEAVRNKESYALAFVDVRLPPGIDGIETVKSLWQADPEIQTVIITAFADYSWGEIVDNLGGTDRLLILKKPFDSIEIRQTASAMTAKWHLAREKNLLLTDLETRVAERTGELTAANLKLVELDQLKSMFIASMSHELRTPLNAIIGFTGIVLDGMSGPINAKQEDQLGRVRNSARHLLALITDVIDISKIESGKIQISPEVFDLEALITDAVKDVENQARAKGLVVEVSVPERLNMHTDRRRLLQCLINLLSNAVKFSERGTIGVVAEENDNVVSIAVSDTGIGIGKEDMPRLFKTFERIDSPLSIKAGGTGLGLYLTRKLATEILQGEIEVESEVGKGSVFRLTVSKDVGGIPL